MNSGHRLHDDEFRAASPRPVQRVQTAAPVVSETVPCEHGEHVVDPGDAKNPGKHVGNGPDGAVLDVGVAIDGEVVEMGDTCRVKVTVGDDVLDGRAPFESDGDGVVETVGVVDCVIIPVPVGVGVVVTVGVVDCVIIPVPVGVGVGVGLGEGAWIWEGTAVVEEDGCIGVEFGVVEGVNNTKRDGVGLTLSECDIVGDGFGDEAEYGAIATPRNSDVPVRVIKVLEILSVEVLEMDITLVAVT